MKKYLFTGMLIACSLFLANAQGELPKYQRNSLHLVLLTTEEPTLDGAVDFSETLNKLWQSYPFPDKYDRHDIELTMAYGGKSKGSLMELINKYYGKLDGLSLPELKEISAQIADNKVYKESLVESTRKMLSEQKVGQQLIRKWYGIADDGSWNSDLLNQRGLYNANQSDVANANATTRGIEAITDMSEDLIGHTFVTFSKLSFYENEPVAAFSRDLAVLIAKLSLANVPGGSTAAEVAAQTAYETACKGYSASTTTVLYRLAWSDSTAAVFYDTFSGDKIDMAKFNAIDFPFELVGVETASSSTFDPLGGMSEIASDGANVAAAMVGVDADVQIGKSIPNDRLIEKTLFRNIDKTLAKMQYNYEVFKPLVQVISTNPLLIDAGMKESISDKDKFDLLELCLNKKTNKMEYKKVATLPVVKDMVWDNRYVLSDEKTSDDMKGTELKANKKASVGMVVRLVSKKK